MGERRNAASLFSHSLKTPLSSVKVAAQLLIKHLSGRLGEKDNQLLELVLRNASVLEARINKLTELALFTEDALELELTLDQLEQIHSLKEPQQAPAPETPPPAPAPEAPAAESAPAPVAASTPEPAPADGKIVVHADPEIADLIPKFLENRHKDIDAIRNALASSDYDSVRILGHSMKGAGGGYGFPGITEIGRLLEDSAKVKDTENIQKGIDALVAYLNSVEVVYDES